MQALFFALTSICTGLSKWTWKVLLEPSEKNFCAFDAKTFPLCFNSILRCEKLLSACFRNFLVSGFHAWYRFKYLILIQYIFIFCFIFSYSTGICFTWQHNLQIHCWSRTDQTQQWRSYNFKEQIMFGWSFSKFFVGFKLIDSTAYIWYSPSVHTKLDTVAATSVSPLVRPICRRLKTVTNLRFEDWELNQSNVQDMGTTWGRIPRRWRTGYCKFGFCFAVKFRKISVISCRSSMSDLTA